MTTFTYTHQSRSSFEVQPQKGGETAACSSSNCELRPTTRCATSASDRRRSRGSRCGGSRRQCPSLASTLATAKQPNKDQQSVKTRKANTPERQTDQSSIPTFWRRGSTNCHRLGQRRADTPTHQSDRQIRAARPRSQT
eukprot:1762052-Rhodomonas_salina.2